AARAQPACEAQQRVLSEVLAVVAVIVSTRPGMVDEAVMLAKEREAISVALDDRYEMVQALSLLAPLLGDREAAEEAVRLARIVANPTMLSYSLSILAMLLATDDPVRAHDLAVEATQAAREVGNAQAAALAQQVSGAVVGSLGDHVSAARMGLAAAEQLFDQGERFFAFSQLWGVASSLNALGEQKDARVLGAWLVRHGAQTSGPSALPQRTSVYLSDEITAEEVDGLDPRVANLSEMELVAHVRALVEGHGSATR
ncbi:MAG: hypothetical protein QOF28_1684, partial [Actinomycetota bacterium]|nr:hypothetical protein [Actinomycetota bacterium]